jgi:nucleoside-diphosphate-sugar epimerase
MLVTVKPESGAYYNIGGEYSCTIGEMLDCLIKMSTCKDIKIKIDKDRMRPIDANLQIPNTTKFKKKTGWKPEIEFEKTMSDLLNYWRNKVSNGKAYLTR